MSKYPSQTQDKFTVRFPDGMRDEIAKRAEANGRSMNSEIIAAIEAWISGSSEDISQKDVSRIIRIATQAFGEEILKNYSLVPKGKEK